ncbi:MAG: hypothetical protein BGO41_11690 [Clostridiales bacterium 38-18]|nr:MAG: hypothetical protein BGO41_11690 [Clostridiales bacterium 38-18]
MKSDFYIGRYALIELFTRADSMNANLINDVIITNSECITTIFPAWWMFNWDLDGTNERFEFCDNYNMSLERMDELCKEITSLFERKELGYPNTIFNIDTARYLYDKYFSFIDRIKLIGIGLEKKEANNYLEYNKPIGENEGELGIYQLLKKKILIDTSKIIGYEILGCDLGILHSVLCNKLETDIFDKLNMKPNKFGLYDSYDETLKACKFIREECDAENALWQPWIVCEYNLRDRSDK